MLHFIIMKNLAQCEQLELSVAKEKPGGAFLKKATSVLPHFKSL